MIKCRYRFCNVEHARRNILTHLRECEYVPLRCPPRNLRQKRNKKTPAPTNLGRICPRREFEAHLGSCRFRPAQCVGCRQRTTWYRLADHKRNECPERFIDCEWKKYGCKLKIKSKEMATHLKSAKSKRIHYELKCEYLERELEKV